MVSETALVFSADHPAFAGHFPGVPIVAGVLMLDAALHAAAMSGATVTGVASAKFLRPVAPGEPLVLSGARGESGRIQFEISSGGQRVAAGQFEVEGGAAQGHGPASQTSIAHNDG